MTKYYASDKWDEAELIMENLQEEATKEVKEKIKDTPVEEKLHIQIRTNAKAITKIAELLAEIENLKNKKQD